MCSRASFLAIRGGKIAWVLGSDSHDAIIEAEGLKDDDLYVRDFVRIECIPRADPFSTDPSEWVVREDEDEKDFPAWYDHEEWAGRILDELTQRRIPEERRTGIIGNLEVTDGLYVYDWITQAANVRAYNGSKLEFPMLTRAAAVLADNGSISAPMLTTAANVRI